MNRILYLHGLASGPSSSKANYFRRPFEEAGMQFAVPQLDAGDFEHLTITGQLDVVEQAAAGGAVSLIGSSLGGYVAALFAGRQPAGVDRVVLLAPAFGFARRWRERLGEEAVGRWRSTGRLELFHYAQNRPAHLGYQFLEDAALYPDYPDFAQPTLIFHGSHDDVVPPRYSEAFAFTHSNAQLEILDSGHELTDQLPCLASRIVDFLR